MALAETPELIIDESDEQLGGLYLRADSRTDEAPTQIFAREMKWKRRLRLVRPARESILDKVWESVDLTGAQFEVAVGKLDQAPTEGSFDLSYDGSTTGLLFLDFDISEDDLQTALQSNTDFTALQTFTFSGSQLNLAGVHQLGVDLRVRVSNSGGSLPSPLVAGTDYWVQEIVDTDSLRLATAPGGSAITLSGGSGTHTLHKTVDVEQTGRVYRVVTNQYAAQETFQSDAENLSPPSSVIIKHPVVGDSDTLDVQTFRIIQQPYAFQDTWSVIPPSEVDLNVVSSGANDAPAEYEVVFEEPPMGGNVRFVHQIPQITEITVGPNTASAASFEFNFADVIGSESTWGGSFIDMYDGSNVITRFWFDYNNTSTSPGSPPGGGTLVEVDYVTVADLITDFLAEVGGEAIFTGGALQTSAFRVKVTYAAKGTRTAPTIVNNPSSAVVTSSTVSLGSDGVIASRYFFLTDRGGLVCVYARAGLTQSEPVITAVSVNRFLPVDITIDGSNTVVAGQYATAINADAEFSASNSGNIVTVTDAFGGPRTNSTVKTVTFGVAVKREGYNVSASIPWDLDPSAIAGLIGNTRYKVSKPTPLYWKITHLANGAMPSPTLEDESLEWPSRVEGSLDFSTEAIELAFANTTSNRLDATIEVVYTPDGGIRRLILQRNVELRRNMISEGGISIPPFTTTLTSVKTGKTLWVDSVNGTSGGIRGRLDKQYDDPIDAKTAALSGDLIVVMPGSWTVNQSLAKNGVHWYFMPGASITFSSSEPLGIWDDEGSAISYTVSGDGDFIRNETTGGADPIPMVRVSNASSVVRITGRNFELDHDSTDAPGYVVSVEAGELVFACREVYAHGDGLDIFGFWWENGRLHGRGERILCDDLAAAYYSGVTASPTGDAYLEFDEIEGSLGTSGTDTAAASWVACKILRTTPGTSAINAIGTERLYLNAQKVFGALRLTGGMIYVNSEKVSAVANGDGTLACLVQISGGENRIAVRHWDRVSFTGETMKITGGTTQLIGGDLVCGTAKGFEITGGTARLQHLRIDTSGSSSQNPVTKSGGTLVLDGAVLVAESTRDSIEAGTAQNVVAYASYANKAVDGNVTITITGGLTVDTDVV